MPVFTCDFNNTSMRAKVIRELHRKEELAVMGYTNYRYYYPYRYAREGC